MEIFMRSIDWSITRQQVEEHLAVVLHGPNFSHLSPTSFNFHVHLHQDKKRVRHHAGTGALTLPTAEIGTYFLDLHGSDNPKFPLVIGKKRIVFCISKHPNGRSDVIERITLQPYMQPWILAEREKRTKQLKNTVRLRAIQFGWECRDYVLSIECEDQCTEQATLGFDSDRREIRIRLQRDKTYFIVAPYSHINSIHVHNYLGNEPSIVLTLNTALRYECETGSQPPRRRLSFLPIPGHERVVPFASLVLRLVCPIAEDLNDFRRLCRIAELHRVDEYEYPVERRGCFSVTALEKLQSQLLPVKWCVAFQIEALLMNMYLDAKEILELMPRIYTMIGEDGDKFTATTLRRFGTLAKHLFWDEGDKEPDVLQCFLDAEKESRSLKSFDTLKPSDGSLCDMFHVKITPTTMSFEGPLPEQSNRVIRAYHPDHQESFLRVSFTDEAGLQYRFDREIDGPSFIRERVGPFLLNGLTIAGNFFEFLAYSQSALKEHCVWFVKPFMNGLDVVDAQSIIAGLGTFDKVDRRLVYCPARYAARISQAFTATDAVQVEVEEILHIDDKSTSDGKYQFTDGVGTMSQDLCREIWLELKQTKRNRSRISRPSPSSYQIRFQGSKGMISVDYKLSGYVMCLRPSMIKFEDPKTTAIEIARAFDRPMAYFLNRPLIMLLEGLGVPYETFKRYQDMAVDATKNAAKSLKQAAALFESHGLGASYRLPSVMLSLDKLHIMSLPNNQFYEKMLAYAINHVLRDLKNYARIPIPGAFTLVGVADVHKYLGPDQIFACVKPLNGRTIFLKGPVLISRSPTIHPGDVQIVHAIGQPPSSSPFAIEPLVNTVVFSIEGDRPVPSCLGGGDLDGDVYNLIPLNELPEFSPEKIADPASYEAVPRKEVKHPSTMADVAEFVMEYINSDVLGLVAINWLITADSQGIFHKDCITLANLHSNAVDYPKSGQPVPIGDIPKLPLKTRKPDWNAPETVNVASSSSNYYESSKAIGRLFRAIDLPVEQLVHDTKPKHSRKKNKKMNDNAADDMTDTFSNLSFTSISGTIEDHVNDYIDIDADSVVDEIESIQDLFSRYASELRGICAVNSLSHARTAQLSEEEAIIGTIIQKSSQPRKRKDMMAALRSSTDILVRGIREQLRGEDSEGPYEDLQRAWLAWQLALAHKNDFGAQSFGWVALGAIFEAIREIEASTNTGI
ncbi:RNA-directed RNA polymerase 2 [Gymnopilus junonius]|uniref:RNA-dependent RNA polymerase n=1 Tax=Gymnopilus junonius TaxID=109634 RepID=A0A9P5NY86_GYMJU|nr:RNA-directed RNA polymerase 2 [Gymnopilus junonius]